MGQWLRQRAIDPQHFLLQKLFVHEMITTTPQSLQALNSFFAMQRDQVDYIELVSFDPMFHFVLSDVA